MRKEKDCIPSFRPGFRRVIKTRTTMFDLIRVLNEVVREEEKAYIPQIVADMFKSGLLKPIGDASVFKNLGRIAQTTSFPRTST